MGLLCPAPRQLPAHWGPAWRWRSRLVPTSLPVQAPTGVPPFPE